MYEFIYCWSMDGQVKWSKENANTLLRLLSHKEDKSLVAEFIQDSEPGDFIILHDGVLISRLSSRIKPEDYE